MDEKPGMESNSLETKIQKDIEKYHLNVKDDIQTIIKRLEARIDPPPSWESIPCSSSLYSGLDAQLGQFYSSFDSVVWKIRSIV